MNRLPRQRFRQALRAGLPVAPRSTPPPTANAGTDSLAWVLTFDAEGRCVSQDLRPATAGAPQGEVFAITGRPHDPNSALTYHRARAYAPTPGRWLNQDPTTFLAADALASLVNERALLRREGPDGPTSAVAPLRPAANAGDPVRPAPTQSVKGVDVMSFRHSPAYAGAHLAQNPNSAVTKR